MKEHVTEQPRRWRDLLEIDWRPRTFEAAFLCTAVVYTIIVHTTHLPFAFRLAEMFVLKLCQIALFTLALSVPIVLLKVLRYGAVHGFSSLRSESAIVSLVAPYWTLNFVMLTLRRGFAVFGTIFFFLHLKHLILWLNTTNNDLFWWNFDRMLHFGIQPNVYLMDVISRNETLTVFIDWMYIKYFDYKLLACVIFLLEPRGRKITDGFFLAYVLLWSIGGLTYTLMPADGPCYAILAPYSVAKEGGGLVQRKAHLFRFPVTKDVPAEYTRVYAESKIFIAKDYQQKLWKDRQSFLEGKKLPGTFYGIAAMPSLHNAGVTLVMLFLFRLSVFAGLAGALMAIMTFVGSVFLQWHYAIDAYVGMALAGAVFLVSMKVPSVLTVRLWRKPAVSPPAGKNEKLPVYAAPGPITPPGVFRQETSANIPPF